MDGAGKFEGDLFRRLEFMHEAGSITSWNWDLNRDSVCLVAGEGCEFGQLLASCGLTRDKLLEVTHPDDCDGLSASLEAALQGEADAWQCEQRFRNPDGDWRWVAHHGTVVRRGVDGRAEEMMGMTLDIHRQKMSRLNLSAHRDMLNTAEEIAKLGYWEYNPDTNLVSWSPQIRKILGVSDDYDPNLEDTFCFFPEKDRAVLTAAFSKAAQDGEPYDLELKCYDLQGELHITRAAASPQVDENGKVFRVVGIFQDITGTTFLENEAQAFFNLSPDFLATLSREGRVQHFNPSWSESLGYPEQEFQNLLIQEIVDPVDREAFVAEMAKVRSGDTVGSFETRVLPHADLERENPDRAAWLSWTLSSHDDLGVIFVAARCITEQKSYEQELRDARARAEEANRAKANFLAVMSHELRTPLNPILGFAEMLAEDAGSNEQRDMLKMIVDAGERMVDLVNEVLEYSKVDAGRARVEPIDFSMGEFVARKMQLMRGRAIEKGLSLKCSIDWGALSADDPPVVCGDMSMLRQVVRNLMSNAIKFTKEGSVHLVVRFLEAKDGRALVEFEVKDTGIGIRPEDLGKLFEPFLQIDSGATREYGGTGLGLAICKRLVELLDGTIRVESKINQGSSFSFQVPLDYEHIEVEEPSLVSPAESCEAEAESPVAPIGVRKQFDGSVLVVEDNESNVIYLQKLLELRGISAVCVNDGESALKTLEEKEYSLVLLDLHMPGIGGIETLRRIRANDSLADLPIYVLTADVSKQAREDSMKFGADGLLTKPVTADLIFELLGEHLQKL